MSLRTPRALLALCASLAAAQQPENRLSGADDFWGLLDDFVPSQMQADHLPGAAVAVVEDGAIVFAEGYGVASIESGVEVSAQRTLFRIGSISKVFAALALTQQAERGKIRLEDPIAPHLGGLAIQGAHAGSLCFWHLMTHSAGFDQIGLDRHARGLADQLTPRGFLDGRLVVVRPPGQVTCYDTYAITLAGHLVEELSGKPYARYLRDEIFEPLGMERTFLQASGGDREHLATGYGLAEGNYVPQPYEYYNTTPASSVDSTALDMARLLVALLDHGTDEHGRILSPATIAELRTPQFRNHPELPGFTHGFWEEFRNGERALQHGGTMLGFSSQLTFFPGQGRGVFTICNRDSETGPAPMLHEVVVRRLCERWFPEPPPRPSLEAAGLTDAERFAGIYADNLYCHTCDEGVGWQWSPFTVRAAGPGELEFWGRRWAATAPSIFQERGSDLRSTFRVDGRGRVTHLFVGNSTYERLGDALLEEAVGTDWRERQTAPLVARVLRTLERWTEAAEAYGAIAAERPGEGRAHFHAGVCWSRAGQARRALPYLERAIELGAWTELAAFHAGAGFASAGEADLAFEWLARALDLGFADVSLLDDPRWKSLRDEPRFAELAVAVHAARARPAIRDSPVPPDSIPRWIGRYAFEAGLQVDVLERDGALVIELPGRAPIGLRYRGGAEFRWETNPLVRIVFESESTRATRLTFYDDDGSSFDLPRID